MLDHVVGLCTRVDVGLPSTYANVTKCEYTGDPLSKAYTDWYTLESEYMRPTSQTLHRLVYNRQWIPETH
ncbi:hypothetical protein RRG08_053568 [Elysia crispata]|uniref:Uncharacterized protein n=1 Tax=Elysia crispata TaxID=231223 RepID=A0AAE0Y1B7_9GAST|nr:hypothetical protein RRG08_053568 [Elysia crispata]